MVSAYPFYSEVHLSYHPLIFSHVCQ